MSRHRTGATVSYSAQRAAQGRAPYRVRWSQGAVADRRDVNRWCATDADAQQLAQAINDELQRQAPALQAQRIAAIVARYAQSFPK